MWEVRCRAGRSFGVIGARLSRRFSGELRYKQRDLDRMHSLAELAIAMISPFRKLRRLTSAEIAVLEAAHTIRCSIRQDAKGEFRLRGTPQMTLEEISTNGHH